MRHVRSGPCDWTRISPPSPCCVWCSSLRPAGGTRRPRVSCSLRAEEWAAAAAAAGMVGPSLTGHGHRTFLSSHGPAHHALELGLLPRPGARLHRGQRSGLRVNELNKQGNVLIKKMESLGRCSCWWRATLTELRFVYIQELRVPAARRVRAATPAQEVQSR